MKRTVALAVFAAALMIGSVAKAAAVDIFANQISATQWTISVTTAPGTNLGALSMTVSGFTSRTLNTAGVPNISAPDSPFTLVDAATQTRNLQVLNQLDPDTFAGLTLVPGGTSSPVVLVTLTLDPLAGTPQLPIIIQDGTERFGNTVYDPDLVPITDFSLTCSPSCTVPPPAPEPGAILLLGLGLAGLGLVRRAA